MRTGNGATPTYSPDDGDWVGFAALLKEWTAGMPIKASDIERFAQHWAVSKMARLRTQREWVKKLKLFLKIC